MIFFLNIFIIEARSVLKISFIFGHGRLGVNLNLNMSAVCVDSVNGRRDGSLVAKRIGHIDADTIDHGARVAL